MWMKSGWNFNSLSCNVPKCTLLYLLLYLKRDNFIHQSITWWSLFVGSYFQCNEKESEILSLSTKIEVLKLRNSELESERSNETYKAKTQVLSLIFCKTFKKSCIITSWYMSWRWVRLLRMHLKYLNNICSACQILKTN
jgi:hypothetical protein